MLIKMIALLLVSISSFCLGYFVKDIKDEIYEIDVTPWGEEEEEESYGNRKEILKND